MDGSEGGPEVSYTPDWSLKRDLVDTDAPTHLSSVPFFPLDHEKR